MGGDSEQKEVAGWIALMRYILPIGFFAGYFLYVLLVVEPTLIYHSLGRVLHYPPFRTSWQFFAESMSSCGGPTEYLSALVSHLFYSNWVGALIYTVLGFSLWLTAQRFLGLSKTRHLGFVAYLPAVALLVVCTGYNHQPLIVISATLGVLFFIGYMTLASGALLRAVIVLLTFTGTLFYLSVNGCIIFFVMVILYELAVEKRFMVAGATAAFGIVVYLASLFFFAIDMHPLRWQLNRSDPIEPDPYPLAVLYGFYLFYPVLLVFCGLLAGRTKGGINQSAKGKKQKQKTRGSRNYWLSPVMQSLVLGILCVVLLRPVFGNDKKHSLKIKAFALEGQWAQLLDYAENDFPRENMTILDAHDILIALYHTDALAEDLFDWPVGLRSMNLSNNIEGVHADLLLRRCNLVFEIGCMTLVEKFAYESLVNFGEHAKILENLAIVNMAEGDIQTARVFLNVLKQDINHSGKGRFWLEMLEDDSALASNDQMGYLRSIILERDISANIGLVTSFRKFLKKNPKNKAAREFMMCQFLLAGELNQFTTNLDKYQSFPGGKLPKAYDQALAFYRATGGKVPCRWEPSASSIEQTKRFLNVANQYKRDKTTLRRLTKQEFADSYGFYFCIHKGIR